MLLVVLACSSVTTSPIAPPLQPGSTPAQKALLAAVGEKAALLSAKASQRMLDALHIYNTPEELLNTLREHLATAEIGEFGFSLSLSLNPIMPQRQW
jgi:hypothetical protein